MRTRIGIAFVAALLLAVGVVPLAAADEVKFTISDGRLSNLSGMVADGDAVWAVNKNDDVVRAYLVNAQTGKVNRSSTTVSVAGCDAVGLAASKLYVADLSGQAEAKLIRFPKPQPGADPAAGDVASYTLKYPDGSGQAKALMVDANGKVFVVAGEAILASGAQLANGANDLTKVGNAPKGITGGTLTADGKMALRSDTEVFILDPTSWKVISKGKIEGAGAGSAIAATPNGLLLAASGAQQQVYVKALSALEKVSDEAPAKPSVQPTPTKAAPPVVTAPKKVATGQNYTGTVLAVLAAALVAGGVGIIVFVKK